jgi:hypothetical protein
LAGELGVTAVKEKGEQGDQPPKKGMSAGRAECGVARTDRLLFPASRNDPFRSFSLVLLPGDWRSKKLKKAP